MKRTHHGFLARLSPEGRVLEVGRNLTALDPGCDDVVRCCVVLEAERKPSRLGRAAQARRAAGGPRAVGRPSVSVLEWAALKSRLLARSAGRCEVPCCTERARDPHHVVACSAGGADAIENLVAICGEEHERVSRRVDHGRLVIQAAGMHLGLYGFRFWIVWPGSADFIGDRTFYDSDQQAPDDVTANFWRVYGGPAPVAKITRSLPSAADSVMP